MARKPTTLPRRPPRATTLKSRPTLREASGRPERSRGEGLPQRSDDKSSRARSGDKGLLRRIGGEPPADGLALEVLERLSVQYPNPDTELHYTNPFDLLVATILSAQSTDERVNMVTPALFAAYPDSRAMANAPIEDLERLVKQTGFFRTKSRALVKMSQQLVEQHGGEVPATMDDLVKLSGVGRKTANVVLGHALGVPGLPVDRHVLRVASRIGLTRSDDPEMVEQDLTKALPREKWTAMSDTLILHGRRICRPKPLCERCSVRELCEYAITIGAAPLRTPRNARPRSRAPLPQPRSRGPRSR